jgi:hypothetical protein
VTSYQQFLAGKQARVEKPGRTVTAADIHPMLHDWQNELVQWAVRTGRAALWADTGMGKTVMQLEWARLSGDRPLVVAPMAVCQQTVREAAKLGIPAKYVRGMADLDAGVQIHVTNYERLQNIPAAAFDAIVLDESSILKQSTGATRTMLIDWAAEVPFKLACSATPAPNDPEELTNQAEWLGRMSRTHMLAAYFIHDSDGWRPKNHGKEAMYQWMSQWAVAIRKPSDVGGDDTGYDLPGLEVISEIVTAGIEAEGQLFATELGGVTGRSKVRRSTLTDRVDRALQLVHDCTARAEEREAPPALRRGLRVPRTHESSSGGIPKAPSAVATCVDIRTEQGRNRVLDRPGMPDLPRESPCRSNGQDAHRPRPQDGHGPRCALSVLQPGARPHGRRPDQGDGDVRLHHACREQWVIWCGLNDEQDALAAALGADARSIDGRTAIEDRVSINEAWIRGEFRVLIVKPGMYSQGMNWQHCHRMAFVGLGDSFEQYYQAIRRCYRYGQTEVVHAHIILSDLETQIADNVRAKERQSSEVTAGLIRVGHKKWIKKENAV